MGTGCPWWTWQCGDVGGIRGKRGRLRGRGPEAQEARRPVGEATRVGGGRGQDGEGLEEGRSVGGLWVAGAPLPPGLVTHSETRPAAPHRSRDH